ncbi:ABC transporter substrate-binding protein [Cesiribacter andamanensis]|uniref:Outer membrane assembly lipoprotein YfiO n=1 Tax=Cesiribacter andamanensis AMV16 TaxID=1279009 RepID=M7NLQ2_9BACT|nr:ABC transporter substrate-binding protein [Cesiribacter andamanensis]EMR02705.1 outer membrane assembly lipoprotein YfiO [Cesiribacter andamanensis AMV16]
MMRNKLLILVLCLLMGSPLLAQRDNDVQQQYLRAKGLFSQEQWLPAMESFRQVAANPSSGDFAQYASFYYSVAAARAGRTDEAKAMLRQIQQKYPRWDKQDEVSYWLARVYLEEGSLEQGIGAVEQIRNRSIKADGGDMARFYLQRDASIEQLKGLLARHPTADYVAQILARKISNQPIASQDQRLLNELISRYKLDKELLSQPATAKSVRKEAYTVAVMLPFMLDNLQPERNIREIYFPLDIYEGMKLAQKELAAQGITVNLLAYDTRRDSLTTVGILRSPEMKNVDLIVGPLYPGPTRAALEYSFNNAVNLVNPISVNPDFTLNNPYSFLFKPSLETQARKAADFAARSFHPGNAPGKALVVFGTQARDTLMARVYKRELEKKGFNQVRMEQIRPGDEKRLRSLLVSDNAADMQTGGRLSKEAIGHIFIASEDEAIVANSMNALSTRKDRLPIIGHESWVKKNLVSNSQLERMGVYILSPENINYTNPDFFAFREKYLQQVHAMPSRQAYLGYDLMMLFGRLLNQHGTVFQSDAEAEVLYQGIMCTKFNLQSYQDNQCVPIVQFRNSALEIVYQ